jgi:hypothetical protein
MAIRGAEGGMSNRLEFDLCPQRQAQADRPMKKQRTILVTFAGRRDRMELLTRYAGAAIERGLIDEWHVWEFSRTPEDARWLREKFPAAQATPNNSLEYFRLPRLLSSRGSPERLSFRVRAAHDVHIGLKRLTGSGPSFEIVLGGWGNQVSVIRRFDDPVLLRDIARRDPGRQPSVVRGTPSLLPEFGFSEIDVEIGEEGLRVFVAGNLLLHDAGAAAAGDFETLYRTGYGSNGDWCFPEFENHKSRLFISGPEPWHPKDALFYTRAYQYYNANRDAYEDDIILKCDDDIVYFDLDKLNDFISFRKQNEQYFLISANVVNNGVCAHFQQKMGLIPAERLECELPPGGLCGSLWNDGAKAETIHRLFLDAESSFDTADASPIVWNERVSINFIALLGRDLIHIPDVTQDDEHDLCYGVRKRARKQNCILPQFVASHLSFWRQDEAMQVGEIIKGYEALAARKLAPSTR